MSNISYAYRIEQYLQNMLVFSIADVNPKYIPYKKLRCRYTNRRTLNQTIWVLYSAFSFTFCSMVWCSSTVVEFGAILKEKKFKLPRMGNQFMPEFEVSKWTGKIYTEVKCKRTKYWNMHYTLIRCIKLYKIGLIKLLYYNLFLWISCTDYE